MAVWSLELPVFLRSAAAVPYHSCVTDCSCVHVYPWLFMGILVFMLMQVSVDLVLELASGGSLWSCIQRGGTSEQQAARCVCVCVCFGGGVRGFGGEGGGHSGVGGRVGVRSGLSGDRIRSSPLPYHHSPPPVDPSLRREGRGWVLGVMDVC